MEQVSLSPAIIIGLIFMGIGMIVSWVLRSRFSEYSRVPSESGKTGAEIAREMLHDHGIYDVRIISTSGQLTDHYNPANKTVNLSEEVYHGANSASTAIAAHECGHAVQHAIAYGPLKLRTALVPVQNASGVILNAVLIASMFGGAFLFDQFPFHFVLWTLIIVYGIFALFSVVTLPVEFDASRRALVWIEKSGHSTQRELERSKDALKWAALTYVVAALGALATLIYYVGALMGSNRDD